MVKDFNINTVYQGQKRIIQCPPKEFLTKVAELFHLDVSNIELYSVGKGARHKITPYEVEDLMYIEIIDKSSRMDVQRNLRSYFAGESSKQTFTEKIMAKLNNNTPLTGPERKFLIELCKGNQPNSNGSGVKRKLSTDGEKPTVAHKKIQAFTITTKDSFAQTEAINFTPPNESEEAKKEQALVKLKKLAQSSQNEPVDKEEVSALMKSTYDDRRKYILISIPPVTAVKNVYPMLFCVDEVKNELDRIYYPGKCIEFLSNMEKYSGLILNECKRFTDLYARTEKSMERAHTLAQRKYAEVVGSVLMLPLLLEESLDFINLQDNYHESDVYPYIDARNHAIKEIFFDNVLYKVLVEGHQLCEASNFKEAVLCLVAGYYIFNIEYPESCSQTLIVFEKLFLDSNESTDIAIRTSELIKKLKYKVVWHKTN